MLIVGTFNYLGYDESSSSIDKSDKGKGRGLAEEIQRKPSLDLAALGNNKSTESHQDQTHQLQARQQLKPDPQ